MQNALLLVIPMASIFGDESADKHCQIVFAVAGIIGTEAQWDDLVREWDFWTEGKEFHAAEWEMEYATDPDLTKHRRNLAVYAELAKAIARSGLHAWGVGIDLQGYRASFPNIDREFAYHKCFLEVSHRLVKEAKRLGYTELEFIFDHRQGEGVTGSLYDYAIAQPEWQETGIFFSNKISFTSRKNPRIQVADLVARETMKYLEGYLAKPQRKMRKSMATLATANRRLQFDFLMKEYFEQMKLALPRLEQEIGMTREVYDAWLAKNKITDNPGNRHRFLSWHSAKELREMEDDFTRFDKVLREVLRVPHSAIKAKLEQEKTIRKRKKSKKSSASGRAKDDRA